MLPVWLNLSSHFWYTSDSPTIPYTRDQYQTNLAKKIGNNCSCTKYLYQDYVPNWYIEKELECRSVQLIFVSEMFRFSFSDRCVGKRWFWLPFEVGNFDHLNAAQLQSIFVIFRDDFSTHGEDDTVCISKERPCAGWGHKYGCGFYIYLFVLHGCCSCFFHVQVGAPLVSVKFITGFLSRGSGAGKLDATRLMNWSEKHAPTERWAAFLLLAGDEKSSRLGFVTKTRLPPPSGFHPVTDKMFASL